jgi:hypothetical protein
MTVSMFVRSRLVTHPVSASKPLQSLLLVSRETFEYFDEDGGGTIDVAELGKVHTLIHTIWVRVRWSRMARAVHGTHT